MEGVVITDVQVSEILMEKGYHICYHLIEKKKL